MTAVDAAGNLSALKSTIKQVYFASINFHDLSTIAKLNTHKFLELPTIISLSA